MHFRYLSILIAILWLVGTAPNVSAQEIAGEEKPVVLYSGTPKKYEIADISIEGAENYEDYVIIGLSGLSKGQVVSVPGDEITQACRRYWRHGLFSDVNITAEKI